MTGNVHAWTRARWIRTLAILLLAALAPLWLALAMAWVNNVTVGWSVVNDFGRGDIEDGRQYHGVLPSFDALAVDFTTISILIPLAGILFIAAGMAQIIRSHEGRAGPHFPFCRLYNGINVAHGLIGTVLGCILAVGATKITGSLDLLYSGMFAALWSTAVAFIWVYTIGEMAVKPLMQWCYNQTSTGYAGPDPSAEAAVEAFADKVVGAGNTLAAFSRSLSKLSGQIGGMLELSQKFSGLLDTLTTEAEARRADAEARQEASAAMQKAMRELAEAQKTLLDELDRERTKREEHFARLRAVLLRRAEEAERDCNRVRAAALAATDGLRGNGHPAKGE